MEFFIFRLTPFLSVTSHCLSFSLLSQPPQRSLYHKVLHPEWVPFVLYVRTIIGIESFDACSWNGMKWISDFSGLGWKYLTLFREWTTFMRTFATNQAGYCGKTGVVFRDWVAMKFRFSTNGIFTCKRALTNLSWIYWWIYRCNSFYICLVWCWMKIFSLFGIRWNIFI